MTKCLSSIILSLVLVTSVAACEVDSAAWLSYAGQRYDGAVMPLEISPEDVSLAGPVDDSNDPVVAGGEVLALRGIDTSRLVLTPGRSADDPAYFVFRARSLGSGNLFTLVPELCEYAEGDPPEC